KPPPDPKVLSAHFPCRGQRAPEITQTLRLEEDLGSGRQKEQFCLPVGGAHLPPQAPEGSLSLTSGSGLSPRLLEMALPRHRVMVGLTPPPIARWPNPSGSGTVRHLLSGCGGRR
ncbi:hypothetical protein P7K49_015250, partial [Saguinus oedipus]